MGKKQDQHVCVFGVVVLQGWSRGDCPHGWRVQKEQTCLSLLHPTSNAVFSEKCCNRLSSAAGMAAAAACEVGTRLEKVKLF